MFTHARFITVLVSALTWGWQALAADVSVNKGALLFSDDFSVPEVGKAWRIQWPGLTVADGALDISQLKPAHSAVGLVAVGRKDLVIEFKFKLGAATGISPWAQFGISCFVWFVLGCCCCLLPALFFGLAAKGLVH